MQVGRIAILPTVTDSVARRYSIKRDVLKNFAKFTEKYLCWSLFFRMRSATLLRKRTQDRCFPVNFAKFFRTPFFMEHLRSCLSAVTLI